MELRVGGFQVYKLCPPDIGRSSVQFLCHRLCLLEQLLDARVFRRALVERETSASWSGWLSRLGGLLAKSAMRRFVKKLDYAEYGGAPLLGIQGVSIIGHGRSDGRAVASGIRAAVLACEHRINEHIQASLHRMLPQAAPVGDGGNAA